MELITIENLANYIFDYVSEYRKIFDQFITSPPNGPGYPNLPISPFLISNEFKVLLSTSGVAIFIDDQEPEGQWYVAGGPALKVDVEPTKSPPEIAKIIQDNDLTGKPIGIYRIVAQRHIPATVWRGRIRNISYEKTFNRKDINVALHIKKVESTLHNLICDLTFGAYGIILDPHLPSNSSPTGEPHIIKNLGFFPADLNNKRFFSYLEIHGSSDISTWDKRNIKIRVKNDLRRDFVMEMSKTDNSQGGIMSLGESKNWIENYTNRLNSLKQAIDTFRNILAFRSDETEDIFHDLIKRHPLLLDLYGQCESKPHFRYPDGDNSPIGKSYLEPDFIVTYPDKSYKLVELERASKNIATAQGQPRSEVNQAVFQTAEWVHFIREHYSTIRNRYPGIHTRYKTCIIISRSTQSSFKSADDINRYKELIISQFNIDEILTYDDLFERACSAYTTLTGLSPHSV